MATHLGAREILGAAWPLFKACVPVCLPLAVVGVAAGATPGSEAALSGSSRAAAFTAEWWGLTLASAVLTLICYGAVLRQQMALAQGRREPVIDSIRNAAVDVPFVLPLLLLFALLLAPAMLLTAWQGFGAWPALLTVAAGAAMIHAWFAWPALVAADMAGAATRDAGARAPRARAPFAALRASLRAVRGRWLAMLQVAAMLLAAVLVFVLLTGILIGVVMGLAGQATPTAGGLALSRWLMALVLAVPVVYGGAVTVSAWRALSAASTAR